MNISRLELLSADLLAQRDFYANVLDLPVILTSSALEVKVGTTDLVFKQAWSDFDGAYHFAFNIPENQFHTSKEWISRRIPLLRDNSGQEEFESKSWNSESVYFLDAGGNVLEFIARHNLNNAAEADFDSQQSCCRSTCGEKQRARSGKCAACRMRLPKPNDDRLLN